MTPINSDTAAEAAKVQKAMLRPFAPQAVKWKPQSVKGNRALVIAFIDARLVMDRLDNVAGIDGWRDEYTALPTGEVECRLSVRIAGAWVTKADVGSPSEQPDAGDRMKAAFSDALKRAAVKFGIGRYLYRLPHQWVDYDPVKKRLMQVPTLPAFAIPDKVPEGEEPDAAPEPDKAPGNPAAATTAAPTNKVPLREVYAQRLNQCKDMAAYNAIACDAGKDSAEKRLSEADKNYLRPIFEAAAHRLNPKAKQKV